MHEHRLLVMENKARADASEVFYADVRAALEHRCLDVLELAAEVRVLTGRLEAVCGVLSDAAAFGRVAEHNDILEAVRGG